MVLDRWRCKLAHFIHIFYLFLPKSEPKFNLARSSLILFSRDSGYSHLGWWNIKWGFPHWCHDFIHIWHLIGHYRQLKKFFLWSLLLFLWVTGNSIYLWGRPKKDSSPLTGLHTMGTNGGILQAVASNILSRKKLFLKHWIFWDEIIHSRIAWIFLIEKCHVTSFEAALAVHPFSLLNR